MAILCSDDCGFTPIFTILAIKMVFLQFLSFSTVSDLSIQCYSRRQIATRFKIQLRVFYKFLL